MFFDGLLLGSFWAPFKGPRHADHVLKIALYKDQALLEPFRTPLKLAERCTQTIHVDLEELENDLAIDLNVDGAFLEMAEYGPWKMVFVDRTPLVIELLDEEEERCVFLTLRGFLQHMDALKWVEVDHGAIPFLMNGADCMVAGVHGAEPSVQSGDLVWIRDMTHKRPLALGWAMDDAVPLIENTKGKGIKTVHWVGDELWDME